MAPAGVEIPKGSGIKASLDYVYIPDMSAEGASQQLHDVLRSENNVIASENIHVNFIPEKIGFDQKRAICSVLIFYKSIDPEYIEKIRGRKSPVEAAQER
jgi:hypothetical protein